MVYKFRDVHTHQAVPIPPGEYVIGREDTCDVHVENTSVSRRHAKITNDDQGVWIEDLGSSNGTALHGQPITGRTALAVDDVIYFGTACYRLEPEVAGEPTPAPLPQAGLKPAGLRNLMRKTTDRVPLGSIRFDDVPSSTPSATPESAPEITPVTTPEPVVTPVAAPIEGVTPVKSAAREKISTYPTITLPANRPQTRISVPTPASVASVPTPTAPQPVAPSPVSQPVERELAPAVSWTLTLWLTFGSGLAVGILAGIGIAYFLFAVAKAGQ